MFRSPLKFVFALVLLALSTSLGPASASMAPSDSPSDSQPDWTIAVPDSDVVVRGWGAIDNAAGVSPPRYSIALDGRRFSAPRPASFELKLRYANFDPLSEARPSVPETLASRSGERIYVVQFVTQPLEAYRQQLEAAGAEVFFYLAHQAHIVRMPASVASKVETLPFVRWVGPLAPAYRTEEFLIDRIVFGDAAGVRQTYNVMLLESDLDAKHRLARKIERLGGETVRVDDGKYLLRAVLTTEQLAKTLRLDDVLFVDRWSPLESDMDVVREAGGANFLEFDTPEGYDGEGVRAEVFDLGFNLTHDDFASRPLIVHGDANVGSHGASASGVNFGDGSADPDARGLLPAGQGIVAEANLPISRYEHTGELLESPYFASFQTASVGSNRTFFYTTISADHDAFLFDWDILHCQSQSNAGNQDSRPEAWAKNVLSGGGIRHYNTLDRSDDSWDFGASIGPADDGRVKPDLAAFYDLIYTTGCNGFGTCGNQDYTQFCCTSAATPVICGHAGLFLDMWADGLFGNPVDGTGNVFDNRPHMTTTKAALINAAEQWDWTAGGPNSDIDRFKQGWGMPDVQKLYERRNDLFIVDETTILGNLETAVHVVNVAPGETELKATMVYADPPGIPLSDQHRVNDLSLRVTSPTGTNYWGNHGLIDGLWSTPGGTANTIDTVENVFVQSPQAGDWTIEVIASELVQDSHVETPAIDADYALVVSGAIEAGGTGLQFAGPDPGIAGIDNTFSASGATPGAKVWFVFGAAAGSTQIPNCPGIVGIDGAEPLGSATADGNGDASLTFLVPDGVAGRTGFFAAIDVSSCSSSEVESYEFP